MYQSPCGWDTVYYPLPTCLIAHCSLLIAFEWGGVGAQDFFVELARRGLRDLRDEADFVRDPPAGDFIGQEVADLRRGGRLRVLRFGDDEGDGPLDPLRVRHDRAFQFDGGDPLATGLNDVLRAVHDRHEAIRVNRRDIAGFEPAIV